MVHLNRLSKLAIIHLIYLCFNFNNLVRVPLAYIRIIFIHSQISLVDIPLYQVKARILILPELLTATHQAFCHVFLNFNYLKYFHNLMFRVIIVINLIATPLVSVNYANHDCVLANHTD